MSLSAALRFFLDEYPNAATATFAGSAVARFIRKDVPEVIRSVIGTNDRYLVQGSPGQGNWARVPWAAVFDRLVTESAQDGYYLVYLVREDFAGVHLSLNQGVTSVRSRYGSDAKHALEVRAQDFLAQLGPQVQKLHHGKIDLAVSDPSGLGAHYERGSICSTYYARNSLPSDSKLADDLLRFLRLYLALVSGEVMNVDEAVAEDDESELGVEDLRTLRTHKRIERNKKLSESAKRAQGYKCKACGFDFEKTYGALGHRFIEAHHLTPLSSLNSALVVLDPQKDFTVLCANCHRMIHRSEFVGGVNEFKKKYLSFLCK